MIRSDQISRSVVSNSVTPWMEARQTPLSTFCVNLRLILFSDNAHCSQW